MFIGPANPRNVVAVMSAAMPRSAGDTLASTARKNLTRGFTLLEVTLAVGILAMMSVAIYRFVQSNLTAMRVSSETSAADARYSGLRDLLMAQWQSLPPGNGA